MRDDRRHGQHDEQDVADAPVAVAIGGGPPAARLGSLRLARQPWCRSCQKYSCGTCCPAGTFVSSGIHLASGGAWMPMTPIKRRHPEAGGYARGEETRARIIATALRVFGEQGFNKASTRQIAADAGVNPPALQYYFGGKEGLHRACAQFIIDRVLAIVAPALLRARQTQATRARREPRNRCAVRAARCDGRRPGRGGLGELEPLHHPRQGRRCRSGNGDAAAEYRHAHHAGRGAADRSGDRP